MISEMRDLQELVDRSLTVSRPQNDRIIGERSLPRYPGLAKYVVVVWLPLVKPGYASRFLHFSAPRSHACISCSLQDIARHFVHVTYVNELRYVHCSRVYAARARAGASMRMYVYTCRLAFMRSHTHGCCAIRMICIYACVRVYVHCVCVHKTEYEVRTSTRNALCRGVQRMLVNKRL